MSFPFKNLVINSHHKLRQQSWLQMKPIFLQVDDVAAGPVSSTSHASVSTSATSFIAAIASPVKGRWNETLLKNKSISVRCFTLVSGGQIICPLPFSYRGLWYCSPQVQSSNTKLGYSSVTVRHSCPRSIFQNGWRTAQFMKFLLVGKISQSLLHYTGYCDRSWKLTLDILLCGVKTHK